MRNVTGAIAKGDDFFNRANEMQAFWSDLATDSLLLLAPRRVGKTSLMYTQITAPCDSAAMRFVEGRALDSVIAGQRAVMKAANNP